MKKLWSNMSDKLISMLLIYFYVSSIYNNIINYIISYICLYVVPDTTRWARKRVQVRLRCRSGKQRRGGNLHRGLAKNETMVLMEIGSCWTPGTDFVWTSHLILVTPFWRRCYFLRFPEDTTRHTVCGVLLKAHCDWWRVSTWNLCSVAPT